MPFLAVFRRFKTLRALNGIYILKVKDRSFTRLKAKSEKNIMLNRKHLKKR